MQIKFPDICPTSRRLTPGQYPVKTFVAINGASNTRLYGDTPYDATMQLEFSVSDREAADILSCYHSSYGGFHALELSPKVWAGLDVDLVAQIPSNLLWKFKEEPQVESLLPGRSKLTASLIGRLE